LVIEDGFGGAAPNSCLGHRNVRKRKSKPQGLLFQTAARTQEARTMTTIFGRVNGSD
jgi:hypothetical protein